MEPAIAYGKEDGKIIDERIDATLDRLLVKFGKEILAIIPSKVSMEVDARFSFEVQGSINKAPHIIDVRSLRVVCRWWLNPELLYNSTGIPKDRVLINVV
jgi:transaldolase